MMTTTIIRIVTVSSETVSTGSFFTVPPSLILSLYFASKILAMPAFWDPDSIFSLLLLGKSCSNITLPVFL